MATPTLDAYRQLNPQDTREDSELVPELIARLHNEGTLSQYPDLVDYAGKIERQYRLQHRPNPAKEFVRSAVGGVDTAQGIGYSGIAQAGDLFGIDAVKNFGVQGYLRNQLEAQQNQPTIGSVDDVHGVGDALYYGLGVAGSQAPQIAATLGTTAAGAGLGFLAGGPAGAVTGGAIGGAAAGYLQGQNYAELATSGGEDPLLTSMTVGALSGVLEMAVPLKIVRTAFGAEAREVAKMGVEELLKRVARTNPSLIKAISHEAAKDAAGEAITEMGQELVTIAGELYSHRNNPNFQISDKEIYDRLINSGAAGAILGGPAGALSGPGARRTEVKEQAAAQARLNAIEAQKAQTLAQFTSQPPESTLPQHVIETPIDQYIQQNTDPRYGVYRGMFDEQQVANDQARYDSENPQAAELLRAKLAQEAGQTPEPPAGQATAAQLPPTEPTGQPTDVTPVDIGPRDETISTGTGVATSAEQKMMEEWKKQIAEQMAPPPVAPTPAQAVPTAPPRTERPRQTFQIEEKQSGPFLSALPRQLVALANGGHAAITPTPEGDIPTKSVLNLFKKLGASDAEIEIYKAQGLDEQLKDKKVNVQKLAQWMEDHAPKVEVRDFQAGGGGEQDARRGEIQHELETAGYHVSGNHVFSASEFEKLRGEHPSTAIAVGETPGSNDSRIEALAEEWGNLYGRNDGQNPADRYISVAPKSPEQMKNAVTLMVRLPTSIERGVQRQFPEQTTMDAEKGILYSGPHFGQEDKNVVVFARAYVEGDTLHIIELQSDWAQNHRENPENPDRPPKKINEEMKEISTALTSRVGDYKTGWQNLHRDSSIYGFIRALAVKHVEDATEEDVQKAKKYLELEKEQSKAVNAIQNHPLLKDFETLGLKAAINYAQSKGLKKIAISDAETAMMTEQHDRAGSWTPGNYDFPELSNYPTSTGLIPTGKVRVGQTGNIEYEIKNPSGKVLGFDDGSKGWGTAWESKLDNDAIKKILDQIPIQISQEKGMRAAYDERLPKIAQKLTGDKGEKVDYGWHKNATFTDPNRREGALVIDERIDDVDEGLRRLSEVQERYPRPRYDALYDDGHLTVRDRQTSPDNPQFVVQGSPVFKDPQTGTSKANITARVYRLEKVEAGVKRLFDGPRADPKKAFSPEDLGEFTLPEKTEIPGEIPLDPSLVHRNKIYNIFPPLRKESTPIPANMTGGALSTLAKEGIRKDERTKKTTKRLIAVKENATGKIILWPVYLSTGNQVKVDNSVESKITSRDALARALEVPTGEIHRAYQEGGQDRANIDKIWDELRAGEKPDQSIEELAKDPKYTPIAFFDAVDPIERKHFVYDNEERFLDESKYTAEQQIVTKGTTGGGAGVPQILERLTALSPRDARAVQVLAGVLEQTTEAKALGASKPSNPALKYEPSKIIERLVFGGRAETFAENVAHAKEASELLREGENGRIFGLFTPEQWEEFKKLIEQKNVDVPEIHAAIDKAIADAKWPSKTAFLASVVPQAGSKTAGEQLLETDKPTAPENEDENLVAEQQVAAGAQRDIDQKFADVGGAPEALSDNLGETQDAAEIPEEALGVVGLNTNEVQGLIRAFFNEGSKEKPAYSTTQARNVREARAESEISSPEEDLEFQAVKEDLRAIVTATFSQTRREMPNLTDDFLYGIYANLDKIIRDSNPSPATYRETSDTIQRIFHATVAWLGDKGVDVRLVESNFGSQVEFLRNEWGRAIKTEDGKRIIILSLADLANPTKANLRTLFHEVAHHMFFDEPVWVQRLIHESVVRLTETQLDVFSKTFDDRIKKERLPASELMEEVLAEHLAFFGIEQTVARSLGQRLIDGIKKAFSRAALFYGELRGVTINPKWAQTYMELRFRDMLDKVITSSNDFDTLTGNARQTAKFQGTFYRQVDGGLEVERWDTASGQFIVNDVVDESVLASEFNLDNRLVFSDVVVRDSRAEQRVQEWTDRFGVTFEPTPIIDVIRKVESDPNVPDGLGKLATALLTSNHHNLNKTKISFIKNAYNNPSFKGFKDTPAVYSNGKNEILIDASVVGGLTNTDAEYIILHEVAHAVTSQSTSVYRMWKTVDGTPRDKIEGAALVADGPAPDSKGYEAYLKKLRNSMDVISKAEAIFDFLKTKKWLADYEYGMTHFDEFLAESLTNRVFQRYLSTIQLPSDLRLSPKKKSIFRHLVELFNRLFTGKEGNALDSTLAATEDIIMVAGEAIQRGFGAMSFAAPVTEQESNDKVKRDLEYEFAALNTQADFYHAVFDKAAGPPENFDKYLTQTLGIPNPERAIQEHQKKLAGRPELKANANMRLSDAAGVTNRVQATMDREQITKRLVAAVSTAAGKLSAKMTELKDQIPKHERDLEKAQNRFVSFEAKLHDVTTIRDNALKILRRGLRGAERNAVRLAQWAARHDGLQGVAADLFNVATEDDLDPDDADLVMEAMEDHEDDFFVTDTLTAAIENNIDFDVLAPWQIERQIQDVYKTTKDVRLAEVADGSPKAKAELALLIYYAKTAPEDMAALAVRVEKDPERKEQILATIKKIIRGNVDAAEGLNDLFKDVRSGDVKVGKAKSSLMEAVRQLKQAKTNLNVANVRAVEMERAAGALNKAVKKYQAEIGFRGKPFEPYDGAPILLTPGNDLLPGTLKLGPNSGVGVNKILMENIKWLNTHNEQDLDWQAIKSQSEGLKKVAGGQVERSFRNSRLTRLIGSIPERLNNIGIPLLRQAGNRWHKFYAARQEVEPIVTRGKQVSEAYVNAMKITGFNKSYQGFKDTFWNPAGHFLRHLTLLRGATVEENRKHAKDQLRMFFMRNTVTKEAISKPDAFDTVWNALQLNADVSKSVAQWAAKNNVLVEDEDVRIINPRTGKVEIGLRPAMDVGVFTTQSSIEKIFGIKNQLDAIKDGNGESMWAQWAHNTQWKKWASEEERAALTQLFTPEVIFHFVQPFIFDTGTLHFDAPRMLDGVTQNKAKPLSVQTAWDTADGDVLKFANGLFEMEYALRNEQVDHNANREQFVNDTIDFFRQQYKKIYDLAKKQEQFNIRGMRTDSFLASPMMNNIKAGDFPPEFMDYYIYDHDTLRVTMDHLAAHAAFGRDLGLFSNKDEPNGGYFWELETAKVDLENRKAEWIAVTSEIRRANPRASVKEIEAEAKKQLGDAKFTSLKNIQLQERELTAIENETINFFNSARGNTRDMTLPQSIIGGVAGAMVNNFKSAINQVSQAFEPFMVYGVGKVGMQQAFRTLAASSRNAAGSLVQAVSGQALLASEYARFMSEHGIGRDPANFITSSQIASDPGKNNIYEDKKLLGWVRKGRSFAFDTGFRGAEGERIAPKFRLQALFSIVSISLNQGAMEAEIRLYNETLKQAVRVMASTPGALNDPAFQFTGKDMKISGAIFGDLAWEELKNELKTMGTTLEIETRALMTQMNQGKPLGNIVVNPDLARLIAGRAMQKISLPNDISSSASWMSTSPLGRMAMPLISWSLNKTNQLVGAFREPNGEASRRAMVAGIAALAVGMVPAAILISLLTDQYDERILSKKSNLVGFNFDSPTQTAVALMERVGRIGTFGMAGDLVNGVRVYGTSGDLRGVSVDQRVVFVNTLMSLIGLASTAYNQEGTLTYDTFYRPLLNTVGGSGILQNQQILNNITNSVMGVPVFRAESETTARLNALNYLRGAGRVLELDVRTGSGMKSLPNPTKPWINEMVVAAYSNNRSQFIDAYRKAIDSAREEGKQDPEDYVKSSFRAYHPLRYVFTTAPSKYEVGQIMSALSDKGQEDVSQALQYFNAYGTSIGIKPYEGREVSTKTEGGKKEKGPWSTAEHKNIWGKPEPKNPWK